MAVEHSARAAVHRRAATLFAGLDRAAGTDRMLAATVAAAHRSTVDHRSRLMAVGGQIRAAAAAAPDVPAGARQVQSFLAGATRDIHRIVAAAALDSGDGAALLRLLGDGYRIGPALPGADAAVPLPDDPVAFRVRWARLDPAQRERCYARDRMIGNHPGMPFADRDRYNRRHLDELIDAAGADVDRLAHSLAVVTADAGIDDGPLYALQEQLTAARRRLDDYRGLRAQLRGPTRLLSYVDGSGRAAVSLGNPDTARRNAVFVPGTGQDLSLLDRAVTRAGRMLAAARRADPALAAGDVAVTAWLGYDRPMGLIDAADPGYAHRAADALAGFEAGLRASHAAAPSLDTVIGHSYGSTVIGAAAGPGRLLAADRVVAVGSPGVLVPHAADLHLRAGAEVFTMRARNDAVEQVAGWTLGPDPITAGFGGTRLAADPGPPGPQGIPGTSIAAHSSYWDVGNRALANLGAVIAGTAPPYPG